jgi:hypothetical protein
MKTIGIVGSRRRNTVDDLQHVKSAFAVIYKYGDALVSGGCPKGADRFAELVAKEYKIPITIHHAEWKMLGKRAGIARNGLIARDADVLIACVATDRTGGTEDTIRKFKEHHPEGELIIV